VLAGGGDWWEAKRTGELAVACVVRAIKDMGLKVAPKKTEAMYFHGTRQKSPKTHLRVDGIPVQLGQNIKYLGLWLDSTWKFDDHFGRLVGKIDRIAAALSRLMPNMG